LSDPTTRGSTGRDVLTLLAFFLAGVPMAYFIWHTLSDLLRGIVDLPALAITAVLVGVFIVFARFFGSTILRMADRKEI
jgi:hypothetical protein